MTKKVPFKSSFDDAKKFDRFSTRLLYFSTILMIGNFSFVRLFPQLVGIIHWIDIVNCIVIILFAVCEFIANYIHFDAESYRRGDLVDNAWGTKLAEARSENYYTNNDLQSGLYKLAVNNFESCFFSYRIAKESLLSSWMKTGIISLVFLCSAISGFDKITILIIQLAIPLVLVQQSIKNTLLVSRLKDVFEKYRTLFNALKIDNIKNYEAEIIRDILEYETTISWGNILLCDKTYNNMNELLSKQWDELKTEYKIR